MMPNSSMTNGSETMANSTAVSPASSLRQSTQAHMRPPHRTSKAPHHDNALHTQHFFLDYAKAR